jgi:subtilisin family serine protease
MKSLIVGAILLQFTVGFATVGLAKDALVQFTDERTAQMFSIQTLGTEGVRAEPLHFAGWVHVTGVDAQELQARLQSSSFRDEVMWVQPNYKLRLIADYRLRDQAQIEQVKMLMELMDGLPIGDAPPADNPPLPNPPGSSSGADPLYANQWGMKDIGVTAGWKNTKGSSDIVVAVIDTGVDYTHEDLVGNLWRNPGETGSDSSGRDRSSNGIDDDGNGFVDDVIGWDFVSNDNKPFDLAVSPFELLLGGGNPGHGTHCAGNVAAQADNGKGVVGVAPGVRIMPIRFLSEKGQGTTVDAVKSVLYAVRNGARVLSNSWGSSGEDPNDAANNKALRDAVDATANANALFIAAAGNGDQAGKGYDNDTSREPAYPASYPQDVIISVAAIDDKDALGSFSNWGVRSVDIGAPGVKVFSTTVGSKYSDTVIDLFGLTVHWDGTSMATPHVAGAAALYWSLRPRADWREVKGAILGSATQTSSLRGKVVSGGKLNVSGLMR